MIEALVFDLDGTLYDYESISGRALKKAYGVMKEAINLSYNQFLELRKEVKEIIASQISGGMKHDKYLQFQLMLEELGIFDGRLVLDMGSAYWKEFLNAMKRDKQLVGMFKKFSQRFRIGILTDLYLEIQLKKLKKLGILDFVDAVVTSEEVEREKPSKHMFLDISYKLGVMPYQCIYFGDTRNDILGASFVGMRTVAVGRRIEGAELSIKSIYEAEKAVERFL